MNWRMCKLVGLINSDNFNHLIIDTHFIVWYITHLFLFKPELNEHSASLFSAFNWQQPFWNLQITLIINVTVQTKVNRELTSLGADLTSTYINEGNITCSKSKINVMVQNTEENNVLPLQEPAHNDNADALAGAATAMSLLSPPTDNSQQSTY